MEHLETVHFSPLSSQGNVYTFAVLNLANNTKKLLVASLKREVICIDYQEDSVGVLIPTTKEVTFTYLPIGAEIISIAAFNKSETKNDFVIGITIIKDSNTYETYLNIYSGLEENFESSDFNMESISQNCVNNIELKFIPYHLIYTYIIEWDEDQIVKEGIFLLSGSDNKVHLYRENKTTHSYSEADLKEHFTELINLPEVVMWMDIYYCDGYTERISALGCENGYVRLCKVDVKTNGILFNLSTRLNNTISLVRIYQCESGAKRPPCIRSDFFDEPAKNNNLNLLVVCTTLPVIFFADILTCGLKKYRPLPRPDFVTVQSCAVNADVDLDGSEEIIVGKQNELVLYKLDEKSRWRMSGKPKRLPTRILGLKYIDVTGDGVKELVVVTLKGVHILQHNQEFVSETIERKLRNQGIPSIEMV